MDELVDRGAQPHHGAALQGPPVPLVEDHATAGREHQGADTEFRLVEHTLELEALGAAERRLAIASEDLIGGRTQPLDEALVEVDRPAAATAGRASARRSTSRYRTTRPARPGHRGPHRSRDDDGLLREQLGDRSSQRDRRAVPGLEQDRGLCVTLDDQSG